MRKPMNTAQLYIWQLPDWPNWQFDQASLTPALALARQRQGVLLGKMAALGLADSAGYSQQFWIQEAIATAAIEGQQLDLASVRSSVMRKLGLADDGPVSHHADGLIAVLHDAHHQFTKPLDAARLCLWQSALFPGGSSGITPIQVGQFRSFAQAMLIVSGRPGKEVIHYRAPDSDQVPSQMAAFLAWFNQSGPLDGMLRAALAHLWFETIHPFEDGNGRLGRALVDMALAQDLGQPVRWFSLSRQLLQSRVAYYAALQQAQCGSMDVTPWLRWFVEQICAACVLAEQQIDQALHKARFWQQQVAYSINARQQKTLQKLLDAGDGGFLGGLSAEKYCKITGASKATATRDLADLLTKGLLRASGVGKATRYQVNVPEWTHEAAS